MDEALAEAAIAGNAGEVPVGAVVWKAGEIISRAHNLTESRSDVSAHAEVLALRHAGSLLRNWRITESILCVTLEPCTMCIGAIRLARVPVVIFGASDPRAGAAGSLYDLALEERLGPAPRVIRGVSEDECAKILNEFFARRRLEGPR